MSADTGDAASRNSFYYRTERRGKKVVRIYIGSLNDPVTRIIRRIDRSQAARRRLNRVAEEADGDAVLDRLIGRYDIRHRLVLQLARRKIMKTDVMNDGKESRSANVRMPTQDEFLSLVERAEGGDSDATRDLELLLDRHPEISRQLGNVSRLVESHLIGMASRNSELLRQTIPRRISDLRQSLIEATLDPLDGLVVDHIVTAHLEVAIRQLQATEAITAAATRRRQRMLQQANQRFLECVAVMHNLQKQKSNA